MNDDFAAERFNVPKLEVLDWIHDAGLRCAVHWWASRAARAPAAPVTEAGRVAARTLAPTLAELDSAVTRSGLAMATEPATLASHQLTRLSDLRSLMAGRFAQADVVFVDPDTGVGPSFSPKYILPDEIRVLTAHAHTLIYQHCGREHHDQTAARVRNLLGATTDLACWRRGTTKCIVVGISRTGAPSGELASRLQLTARLKPPSPWAPVP